jgi:hypothetical protein
MRPAVTDHGMDELRSMILAMTPPAASMPRLSGVTSTSRKSAPFIAVSPTSMAACTAAP